MEKKFNTMQKKNSLSKEKEKKKLIKIKNNRYHELYFQKTFQHKNSYFFKKKILKSLPLKAYKLLVENLNVKKIKIHVIY